MRLAQSYLGFSTRGQESGDTIRRQIEGTRSACKRNKWTLSDLRYADHGRSAHKGNQQKALSDLLNAIKRGLIKPGEVVIFENLDRLCRKGIEGTQDIVSEILKPGVDIFVFMPSDMHWTRKDLGDPMKVMMLAHQAFLYSKNLSDRGRQRNEAICDMRRNGKSVELSSILPSWLEKTESGKVKKKSEAVKAEKFIFKRTIAGAGRRTVAKELNEKFPPITTRHPNLMRLTIQHLNPRIKPPSQRTHPTLQAPLTQPATP